MSKLEQCNRNLKRYVTRKLLSNAASVEQELFGSCERNVMRTTSALFWADAPAALVTREGEESVLD